VAPMAYPLKRLPSAKARIAAEADTAGSSGFY